MPTTGDSRRKCYTRAMPLALVRAVVGGWVLVAILVVVVLKFSVVRIPALARHIGAGVRRLRDARKGGDEEKREADAEKARKWE